MKSLSLVALLSLAGAATSAQAFEFRARFVERVGNTDVVIAGNTIDASNREPRRIRVQFGVFDNASGAAPAGGFLGWNLGTLAVSGTAANSDETRTPGRLAPFNFSPQPNANGNPPAPIGDPFTMLSEIDNTLGPQNTAWPVGAPGPNPAQVRGFNMFVSTYEFTIDPINTGAQDYTVTVGGSLLAATEWRAVGQPIPPSDSDGDGVNDTPGSAAWAPLATAPQPITATLNVFIIPAPATASLIALGGLAITRRRR